jgi:hypothetical protein
MAPVAVMQQSTLPVSTPYASFTHTKPIPDRPDLSSPHRKAPKERTPPVRNAFAFDTVESAIAAIARGEFVVVMDDESRENEGDLIISAEGCSTEQMAWMIKHTRLVRIQPVLRLRTHRTWILLHLHTPRTPHTADTSVFHSRVTVSRHCPSR